MNKDRVVSIQTSSGDIDWRKFLARTPSRAYGVKILDIDSAIYLVLADEKYSYNITNTTSTPMKGFIESFTSSGVTGAIIKGAEAIRAAGQGTENSATFNPWFKNLKAWESTEPVRIPLSFSFKLGQYGLWNAKKEVALPVLALLTMVLPEQIGSTTMTGPFQAATALAAQIIASTLESEESILNIGGIISSAAFNIVKGQTYTISIGRQLELKYAYCLTCDVSLSTNTDQYGFPIEATIALNMEGSLPPSLGKLGGDLSQSTRFFNER